MDDLKTLTNEELKELERKNIMEASAIREEQRRRALINQRAMIGKYLKIDSDYSELTYALVTDVNHGYQLDCFSIDSWFYDDTKINVSFFQQIYYNLTDFEEITKEEYEEHLRRAVKSLLECYPKVLEVLPND